MRSLFAFWVLLSCICLPSFIINGVRAQNLINKTCKAFAKADPNIKYNFCATSLHAAPASDCATLRGLGTINIRLIRYNVTDTRCHIKHLIKDKKLDRYVKMCLSDCLEIYADAVPDIKQAMKDYNSKRLPDASVHISAVMDAATTCENGFKERKGVVSPLTKRNNDTFQLSAMALSLINMIQTAGSAD